MVVQPNKYVELGFFSKGQRHGPCMLIRNDGSKEDIVYSRDKEIQFKSTVIDGTTRYYVYDEQTEKEIEYLRRVGNWKNHKKVSIFK